MKAAVLKKALIRLDVKQTVLVLAISVLLPFLIHLIAPIGGLPLGARLLPMFYAPLIAIILFRVRIGFIAALVSPTLNYVLTGHPLPEKIAVLTFELVIFCLIVSLIHLRWKDFSGTAALAYLTTLLVTAFTLKAPQYFWQTLFDSFAGLVMLFLINILLLRLRNYD